MLAWKGLTNESRNREEQREHRKLNLNDSRGFIVLETLFRFQGSPRGKLCMLTEGNIW